ncbi:MAG: hypothetical protein N3F65_01635 [Nitrososphaeria archaeon]|nr:hypothetical protein [Aigarchaeota archaeon]MCX8187294.1 hypothetical protein [Nitrososphaeria archaeon]
MDLPLCSFDLRTGIFCPRCSEKLERGLYTDLDIRVMKKLVELEKEFTKLQRAGYVRTVDGEDAVFIVLKEGSLRDLDFREQAQLRKILEKELEKPVRILEDAADPIKFIEKVVVPARIVAINKIWLPDGSEETRIILDHERNLKIKRESLIRVVEEVKEMKINIDFEKKLAVYGRTRRRGKKTTLSHEVMNNSDSSQK